MKGQNRMTKSAGSTRSPWGQSSYGTWGSRPWTSPSLYANLHCRYCVPMPPGGRAHRGPENQGSGHLRLCLQICTAGTLYPLFLGAEFIRDLSIKAPLRFCTQICIAGTVYQCPLGAELIGDLRIKALDLSFFVRKSSLQVQCTHYPWGQSSYGTWGSRPWTSPSLCANLHCRHRYSVPAHPGVTVHMACVCISALQVLYSIPAPPGVRVHQGPEDQGPGPLRRCTQICTAGTVYPLSLGC